jgi:hypothetical protein
MFVIRRVWKVKKGTARKAAAVVTEIGKMYEEAGLRQPSRVYTSGGSVPGPADTVYMEWVEEALRDAYRADNPKPAREDELFAQLREFREDEYVEFYQLYSGS